jgi:hypothetical protein
MPKLTVKTEPCRENLLESLQNPSEGVQYLNACLEDEDAHVFLLAIRDVAAAQGGIGAVSRTAPRGSVQPAPPTEAPNRIVSLLVEHYAAL